MGTVKRKAAVEQYLPEAHQLLLLGRAQHKPRIPVRKYGIRAGGRKIAED